MEILMKNMTFALGAAVLVAATPAYAEHSTSIQIVGEMRDYSDGYGSLDTISGEIVKKLGKTTIVVEPAYGERDYGSSEVNSLSLGGTVYHRFSDGISTRTKVSVSENEPVFATRQVAQDVTFRLLPKTTATVGARWARYFGNQDAYFVSGGLRYHFNGASVAYKATYVDPDNRDAIVTHQVNVSVNDGSGNGKTQLWLSAGEASLDNSAFVSNFSGEDYAVYLRRYQPLTSQVNLIGNIGYTSYDRPEGRVNAPTFGLGLQMNFGG